MPAVSSAAASAAARSQKRSHSAKRKESSTSLARSNSKLRIESGTVTEDDNGSSRKTLVSEVSDAVASVSVSRSPKSDRMSTKSRSSNASADKLWRQRKVRRWYDQDKVQIAVAGLIFGNFIVSATNAQVEGDSGQIVFDVFEVFFNVCFAIELFINMYGHWCKEFWRSPWNVFDFVIVQISIVSMIFSDLPGISVLRLFRAFRVFRLFKRIKSLRMIIEGVLKSLPGVCNAFAVLMLIMSIWAIMAVDFFREDRPVEFGNFVKAVVTFFQIMTYDSWCSGIARDLILEKGPHVAIIFLSYIFVNAVMMTNVVVAVLLEKFIDAMESRKDADLLERKEAAAEKLEEAINEGDVHYMRKLLQEDEELSDAGDGILDELRELAVKTIKEAKALREVARGEGPPGIEDSLALDTGPGQDYWGPPTCSDIFETVQATEDKPQQRHWEARAASFQADFGQELRWMLQELDGLEQDISLLESLPQHRSSPEPGTEIQRFSEQSEDLLDKADPEGELPTAWPLRKQLTEE